MGGLFEGEAVAMPPAPTMANVVPSLSDIKPEEIIVPTEVYTSAIPSMGQPTSSVMVLATTPVSSSDSFAFSAATSESPSMEPFPGDFNFCVRVPPALKSKDAQYSEKTNKLYINQNRAVSVMFTVRPAGYETLVVEGLRIRALCVYTRPDDFPDPVKVCPSHALNSEGQMKNAWSDHLIKCTSDGRAMYSTDPSEPECRSNWVD